MPWKPKDAKKKTKKANTPQKQSQWAAIANKMLAGGAPDGEAIQTASGVIANRGNRKGQIITPLAFLAALVIGGIFLGGSAVVHGVKRAAHAVVHVVHHPNNAHRGVYGKGTKK
jgi:hypothetical protein